MSSSEKSKVKSTAKSWRLKNKEERRFKQGHPWVFSNELQDSPKGIEPGEPIVLRDSGGAFLAYGFGNPNSLIAFRELSRNEADSNFWSSEFFQTKIKNALELRKRWIRSDTSFRAVYGESDGLPGLIIDSYLTLHSDTPVEAKRVFVVQAHSAGMDRALPLILEALKGMGDLAVFRRDMSSREKEGLKKEETKVFSLHDLSEVKDASFLKSSIIKVSRFRKKSLQFEIDLLSGQKTGFFFDQLSNIHMVLRLVEGRKISSILDLCSYVGSWSSHLAQALSEHEKLSSVVVADASETALLFASRNVEKALGSAGGSTKAVKVKQVRADLLDPWPQDMDQKFSIVVCDPPALIKSRKAIPQGKHAYVQIMTESLKRVEKGGVFVACSCSQLLSEEDFAEVLQKASKRAGRHVRWIAKGTQSPDHPIRLEFSESSYLKCWVGDVE